LLGLWCPAEQLEGKWQGGGTFAVGQEAEVADAHETFREQVQQEAAIVLGCNPEVMGPDSQFLVWRQVGRKIDVPCQEPSSSRGA